MLAFEPVTWDPEDLGVVLYGFVIEDNKLYGMELKKKFNSLEEVEEYYYNYMSVFGEDGDTPGDAGMISDLDDYEVVEGSVFAFEDGLDEVISKVYNDKYYWLYGSGEIEPETYSEAKIKMWKADTYPQWVKQLV